MKDLLVVAIIAANLPLGFAAPLLGSVLWGWLSFLAPHRVVRGQAFGVYLWWLPLLAILLGAARSERFPLPRSREMILLLAFWAFCALTTFAAAVHPEIARLRLAELSRILLLLLVVMSLALERRRFVLLLWITALAVGVYALGGAAWVLLTGGVKALYGPPASDAQNNNDLAAVFLAVLPFFAYLGRDSQHGWVRWGTLGFFVATVVAILGTYSRAAVLGLGAVLTLLLLCRHWRALAAAAFAFVLFLSFTSPEKWLGRTETIRTFRQEESASMRPGEWYVAMRIGLDHPFLGAGFRPFSAEVYRRYIPDSTDHRDAHNLFLQVFAEHGFPGLALYTALLVSTLLSLQRNARRSRGDPGQVWIHDAARMIQIGLIGYIVDGLFHCHSYWPILFDLLALSMMLDALASPSARRAASVDAAPA